MRISRKPLRGSVTQTTASVRMRPRDAPLLGMRARVGLLAGTVAILAALAFGLWHAGWPQREAKALLEAGLHLTQKAQFAVKDIVIEGRRQVGKDDLFAAVGTVSGAAILDFDPSAAAARIAKLPWVASVVVERRLPDTIFVQLTERSPFARWQHEGHTVVIDESGAVLPEASPERFTQLPLVVGADAAGQAHNLLGMLKDFPAVAAKMMAAVRVSERRWDIHLQPKVVARLPEKDAAHALSRLSDLITDRNILERDIVAIDLRDPDKLFVEPGNAAPATSSAGATHL